MNSIENNLQQSLTTIKGASFSETSLKQFEIIQKQVKTVFLSNVSDDNEKLLAINVYNELLNKLQFFITQFKNKEIIPNNNELKAAKDFLVATRDTTQELLNKYPNDDKVKKLTQLTPIISQAITSIQKKIDESNNPNGSTTPPGPTTPPQPSQNTPPKTNNDKEPSHF